MTRHKHIATRQISRETCLTQSSVIAIIHRDADFKCLFRFPQRLFPIIVSCSYVCISQRSVVMQLRCGGVFYNCFVASFPQNLSVKEFLELVNIWPRYGQTFGGMFYDSWCLYTANSQTCVSCMTVCS